MSFTHSQASGKKPFSNRQVQAMFKSAKRLLMESGKCVNYITYFKNHITFMRNQALIFVLVFHRILD